MEVRVIALRVCHTRIFGYGSICVIAPPVLIAVAYLWVYVILLGNGPASSILYQHGF